MSPNPTPEKPREQAAEPRAIEQELQTLKGEILKKNVEGAVDLIMGKAVEYRGNIPAERINAFVSKLTSAERSALHGFFSEKETDPRKRDLHQRLDARLDALGQEVGGERPTEGSKATSAILRGIDTFVERLGLGDKLNTVAQKLGFEGDMSKQVEQVKNFLVGVAAGLVEKLAQSLRQYRMDPSGVLKTSLELRLLNMNPAKKEAYRIAYTEWMKEPTEASPTDQQAEQYYQVWKKSPAESKPTFAQVINAPAQPAAPQAPATVSGTPQQQPQAKPAEAAPQAPAVAEKVEGTKEYDLGENRKLKLNNVAGKTTVEIGSVRREIKVNGASVPEIAVFKPGGTEKGTLEVRVVGRTLKADLPTLHKSLTENPNSREIVATDGTTKLNLEPA